MKVAEKDFGDMNLSNVKEFGTQYGTAKRGINENGETIIYAQVVLMAHQQ